MYYINALWPLPTVIGNRLAWWSDRMLLAYAKEWSRSEYPLQYNNKVITIDILENDKYP